MKRDARDFILDNLFSMSAYWTCTGTVIASLTSYYAMPLPIANLLTGLTATLLMLQLLGGFWYARTVRKNLFVRCSNALWRLFLPAAFFSVLLPKNIGSAVMTAAYFLTIAVFQIASPSQTDWLVSCVEGNVRKDYYSIREMCFMLSYSAVFCAVSLILYRFNRPETQRAGFFIIAVLISAMMAASLVVLFRLPRPAERKTPAAPLHHMVAAPLHNRDFMRVMAVNVLWSFSCMFVGSFAAVYQIRILNLDFFHIMLWATVANLARSLMTPLMARLAARVGWRNVTGVCMGVMALAGFLWAFTTSDNILLIFPLVSVLGSIPYAGVSVGFLQMQVDTIPEQERSIYFSVCSTANGVASMVGSAVCSGAIQLLENACGSGTPNLRYIFLIGAAGTAACVLASLKIREKKHE